MTPAERRDTSRKLICVESGGSIRAMEWWYGGKPRRRKRGHNHLLFQTRADAGYLQFLPDFTI